jgi:hypothetical protein
MSFFVEIHNRTDSGLLETIGLLNQDATTIERLDEPNGKQELRIVAVYKNITVANFAYNNIVRLIDDDLTNDPYTTYRIKAVEKNSTDGKKTLVVKCEHLKYDLVELLIDTRLQYIQQTPNDILDAILSDYASDWSRGTITNGTVSIESFEVNPGATVYEAIKSLAAAIGQEVYYHAEGSDLGHDADYMEIDLVTIDNTVNGTPGTCVFQDGINIQSLVKNEDIRDNFFTRLYVIGGDANKGVRQYENSKSTMNIEGALFTVKSFAGGVITAYSKNMVVVNDALNGYYIQVRHAGAWDSPATITDSAKENSGDTLTLTGLGVTPEEGDIFAILYDAVTLMPFIPTGQSESTYGIVSDKYENSEFEDFVNHLGPQGRSDFSGTYSGGICQGWAAIGSPTCTEDATAAYIVHGTKCQKVVAADGEGLYREFAPVVSAGEQYSVSFKIRLTLTGIAEGAHLHMRIKYDTDQYWPPGNIEVKEGTTTIRLFGTTFSTPRTYAIQGGNIEHVSGQTPRFEIYADGGGATFYIDSIELVFLPYIPMPDIFVPYDSRAMLWGAGVQHARESLALNQDYNIQVLDLYELDRSGNAAYEFKAGDEVTVTHAGLNISDTVRVVQKSTPNMFKPVKCNVKIESINNGISAKVNRLGHSAKIAADALSRNSSRTNQANRANMAGFYSVLEQDSTGNTLRIGKYVDQSLINGAWIETDKRGRKYVTFHNEAAY